MKKFKKILFPLVIILLVVFGFVFLNYRSQLFPHEPQVEQNYATLKIGSDQFNISNYVGKTALEATQAKADVVTNGTGTNAFITSINGREADVKKKEFWEFDVNGTEAKVGAGTYIIKNHDQIEWKITNY